MNNSGFVILIGLFVILAAMLMTVAAIFMYVEQGWELSSVQEKLEKCEIDMTTLQRQIRQHTVSPEVCQDQQGLLNVDKWWR